MQLRQDSWRPRLIWVISVRCKCNRHRSAGEEVTAHTVPRLAWGAMGHWGGWDGQRCGWDSPKLGTTFGHIPARQVLCHWATPPFQFPILFDTILSWKFWMALKYLLARENQNQELVVFLLGFCNSRVFFLPFPPFYIQNTKQKQPIVRVLVGCFCFPHPM